MRIRTVLVFLIFDTIIKVLYVLGPLTSDLVHELIGDGRNSELEDSDVEDLLTRSAAAAETCSEDKQT